MRQRLAAAGLALTATAALAGCTEIASYDQRMDYLRKVAQRGADTHALIASQEATIDKPRCERAFEGINSSDEPTVLAREREAWGNQVREFFVDSCVSGKPKPVPGDPIPAAPPSVAPAAPSPSR